MIKILETPIDTLSVEQSEIFLFNFISQLCIKHKTTLYSPSKAKEANPNKWIIIFEDCLLTEDGTEVNVEWNITQEQNKTITLIEVFTEQKSIDYYTKNQASEFFNKTLLATTRKKSKYFNRSYFTYINQHNLGHELKVNKNLRIAPLFPEDTDGYVNAERILVIDQNVSAIDKSHSFIVAEEQANTIASILSFIIDLDLCKQTDETRYSKSSKANERVLLGFNDPNPPTRISQENTSNNTKQQQPHSIHEFIKRNITNNQFSLPKETKKILQGLSKVDKVKHDAFVKCCRLYHLGLKMAKSNPTAKIAYMYGAIDSLAKNITNEDGSFSAFMRKYNPDVNEELLDYIHSKIRSSHWHNGNAALGDFSSPLRMLYCDIESYNSYQYSRSCHKEIRKAILKWLFNKVLNPERSNQ